MTKRDKDVKHRPHTLAADGCHFESGLRAENQEVEVDVHRVPLVTGRSFKIDAVRKDLSLDLLLEDAQGKGSPALRTLQLREEHRRVKQSDCLAGQMRVWREVVGEVAFDVGCV